MKYLFFTILSLSLFFSCADDAGLSLAPGSSGATNGSYSNMLVISQHLYVVNDDELITYRIESDDALAEIDRKSLGFGVESMFHRSGVLFIGSRERLYIYRLNTANIPIEESTTEYSEFDGIDNCFSDPVVVEGDIAYVTLATDLDAGCGFRTVNELRLYDISDLQNPNLINTVEMEEPKGLAVSNNILFVCEANNGLKIFNVENSLNVIQLYHFEGYRATDVIVNNGVLLVVGPDNLYEYDYSDLNNVFLTATIDL
jgi:hypothetical protein